MEKQAAREAKRAARTRQAAEQDLPLRPDGSVSPAWAALELVPFDGVIVLETIERRRITVADGRSERRR